MLDEDVVLNVNVVGFKDGATSNEVSSFCWVLTVDMLVGVAFEHIYGSSSSSYFISYSIC